MACILGKTFLKNMFHFTIDNNSSFYFSMERWKIRPITIKKTGIYVLHSGALMRKYDEQRVNKK